MWLLTLKCDSCPNHIECEIRGRDVDRLGGEIEEGARRLKWVREDLGPDHSPGYRYYCPTCRLARERRSLVPDDRPEHLTQTTD